MPNSETGRGERGAGRDTLPPYHQAIHGLRTAFLHLSLPDTPRGKSKVEAKPATGPARSITGRRGPGL